MKLFLIITLTILLFWQGPEWTSPDAYIASPESITTKDPHPGKKLMETYCYACHGLATTGDSKIAPPMAAIKDHYIGQETSQQEFETMLLKWVKDPSEANSKMPGALRKFGVMPYQKFEDDNILKIADYIYNHEIEAPPGYQGRRGNGMKGAHNCTGEGCANCKS